MVALERTLQENTKGYVTLLTWISFLAVLIKDVGATCNTEQVSRCLQAAENGEVSSLASAGRCQAKQYVEFSHICFVKNYLPTVDHCCCVHDDTTVLCCRYQQNWNIFRCNHHKDVIGQVSASSVPLHIVLPVILGSLLILSLLFVCLLKRWCFKYDDDHEAQWCGLCDKKKSKKIVQASQQSQSEEAAGLNSTPSYNSQDSKDSTARLLPQCSHDGSIQPSAPPIEEVDEAEEDDVVTGQFYLREPSTDDSQPQPVPSYARSVSEMSAISGRRTSGGPPPVCPSCSSALATVAPPTYDESRDHPVLP